MKETNDCTSEKFDAESTGYYLLAEMLESSVQTYVQSLSDVNVQLNVPKLTITRVGFECGGTFNKCSGWEKCGYLWN